MRTNENLETKINRKNSKILPLIAAAGIAVGIPGNARAFDFGLGGLFTALAQSAGSIIKTIGKEVGPAAKELGIGLIDASRDVTLSAKDAIGDVYRDVQDDFWYRDAQDKFRTSIDRIRNYETIKMINRTSEALKYAGYAEAIMANPDKIPPLDGGRGYLRAAYDLRLAEESSTSRYEAEKKLLKAERERRDAEILKGFDQSKGRKTSNGSTDAAPKKKNMFGF
ncbi:MAG: hypothetical protein AABW88_03740 [Nanoarchaeota archaeon]